MSVCQKTDMQSWLTGRRMMCVQRQRHRRRRPRMEAKHDRRLTYGTGARASEPPRETLAPPTPTLPSCAYLNFLQKTYLAFLLHTGERLTGHWNTLYVSNSQASPTVYLPYLG